MLVQPYLDFTGRCAEALAFYEKMLADRFGVRWMINTLGEQP